MSGGRQRARRAPEGRPEQRDSAEGNSAVGQQRERDAKAPCLLFCKMYAARAASCGVATRSAAMETVNARPDRSNDALHAAAAPAAARQHVCVSARPPRDEPTRQSAHLVASSAAAARSLLKTCVATSTATRSYHAAHGSASQQPAGQGASTGPVSGPAVTPHPLRQRARTVSCLQEADLDVDHRHA